MGPAPDSVRGKHYCGDKKGRVPKLFREQVTPKIDALCDRLEAAELQKTAISGGNDSGQAAGPAARIIDFA